jgi:hypothetical protein
VLNIESLAGKEAAVRPGRFFGKLSLLRTQQDKAPGLPFAEVLAESRIHALLDELQVEFRERIYSPCVTLWVFLSQVLAADQSCRQAVARLLAFRVANGQAACSTETGSYCEARQRLPEELLQRLVRQTGEDLRRQVPEAWKWRGRTVQMVDGTTVSMPDTQDNARAFGRPGNQHGSTSFPVARLVVLICWATGALWDLALGPYRGKHTGEQTLFRSLRTALTPGDVLLGDRFYGNFADIALLSAQGVDVVCRLNATRRVDFRRGQRLGSEDHLATWDKPVKCPAGLTAEEFAALPEQLTVREVRVRVTTPGFRTRTLVLVTTLTDPEQITKNDLADLYRQRWHAELDLRSIKSVMHLDVLRCQTAEMVRKEIGVHALAYNLLRSLMCSAADAHGCSVREISFKAGQQLLQAFHQQLLIAIPTALEALCHTLIQALGTHRVGDRPDRYEPRKRKREPKPYPPLQLTRSEERRKCLKHK